MRPAEIPDAAFRPSKGLLGARHLKRVHHLLWYWGPADVLSEACLQEPKGRRPLRSQAGSPPEVHRVAPVRSPIAGGDGSV